MPAHRLHTIPISPIARDLLAVEVDKLIHATAFEHLKREISQTISSRQVTDMQQYLTSRKSTCETRLRQLQDEYSAHLSQHLWRM